MLETEQLLHGGLQVLPVAAAGIGLIAHHHAGPLLVGHRVGARVGEQVDVDVRGIEQEGVKAGLLNELEALFAGVHADGLNGLDAVGLSRVAVVEHGSPPDVMLRLARMFFSCIYHTPLRGGMQGGQCGVYKNF